MKRSEAYTLKLERQSAIAVDRKHSSATLTELSEEFVLLTHGLMLTKGELPVDPVQHWYAENPHAVKPFMVLADRPVFSGFASYPSIWDRGVVAVHKTCWPDLRDYLDSIQAADSRTGLYWRALRQELPLGDYKDAANLSRLVPAWVTLNAYGVDGNKGCYHLLPSPTLVGVITVKKSRPEAATVEAARRVMV